MTVALPWGCHLAPGMSARVARVLPWVLLIATLLGFVSPALAADEPASRFVWDAVSVTVQLQEDGTVHVREHDTVQFTGGPFRQGYREIPLANIERASQITVTEVGSGPAQPYDFVPPSSYSRNAPHTYTYQKVGTTMRIDWSFHPTTSAKRSFVIEYVASGVVQVFNDAQPPYQEIWWIGVDRALTATAPVKTAELIITLPRPVDPQATTAVSNGTPFGDSDGQTWTWRAENLTASESLQAVLQFPPLVAVSKPTWQDTRTRQLARDARVNLALLGLALLTAVGGGVGLLAAWWTRGRDPNVGPIPEYLATPPDDTPPGVVGALLDERVEQRDYVATLFDLGRRGVVRITEEARPEFSSHRRLTVTLLEPGAPLAPFETTLLSALFANSWWREAQVRLPLESHYARMHEALELMARQIDSELVRRGFFRARPPRTRAGWRFVSVGLWALAVIVLGAGIVNSAYDTAGILASIALVALGAAVYVVAKYMPQKTRAGAEAAARWQAFRRHMVAIDRVGVGDSGQEGFERYLPYAIALGVEGPWISAFAHAETTRPQWYDLANLDEQWRVPAGRPHASASTSGPSTGALQGASSLTATSLQSSSGSLFNLFNAASVSFNPAQAVGDAGLSGSGSGVKLGSAVFEIMLGGGSGGGGGGFS